MPKARISAAMLTPRDRAHAADRRGLQFLAAGVATVARTRTSPGRRITSHRIGLKFPAQRLEVPCFTSREIARKGPRSGWNRAVSPRPRGSAGPLRVIPSPGAQVIEGD